MDDSTDIVAIISAAIAAVSLLLAGGGFRFARRADRRAAVAEERATRAEHRAERGQPSARFLACSDLEGSSRESAEFMFARFQVTNVGAAGARHVTVHLIDADGHDLDRRSGEISLAGGAESDEFKVGVPNPGRLAYPLAVRLEWWHWERDPTQTGPYAEMSRAKVPDPFLPDAGLQPS
jgi:hypothetical protein